MPTEAGMGERLRALRMKLDSDLWDLFEALIRKIEDLDVQVQKLDEAARDAGGDP